MNANCVCPEVLILTDLDQLSPDGQKPLAGFRKLRFGDSGALIYD